MPPSAVLSFARKREVLAGIERRCDAAHVAAPVEAPDLLHLLAQAEARRRHQRIGADDRVRLRALGQMRRVGVERLLQLRLDLGIGRAAGEADQLEQHLALRLGVLDQLLRAHARAHLRDVAPAVEPDSVELVVALSRMIGLLTADASTYCSAIVRSRASLPNTIRLVTSTPCSGCPPVRCASQM